MTTGPIQPAPEASAKAACRLKTIGISVLVLGGISAGIVYWRGARESDLGNNPAMLRFDRAESRQMGLLYGQSGTLIDDLTTALHRPGVQAIVIVVAAVIIAAVFFLFARLPPPADAGDFFKPSSPAKKDKP